ncbi:hypothetical protein [Nocardioides speluncae]|uniref:hypothetical protein n=1 Tax=Nocardioides speluncae TaxID=2670337 RepID=UPI000D69E3E2|nr:hypothetical protein [Nocardioides speluncae]
MDKSSAQPQRTGAELVMVRVWFGRHIVCEYSAVPSLAERYAAAMGRRFLGVRVSTEPDRSGSRQPPPLPAERMWELPPR